MQNMNQKNSNTKQLVADRPKETILQRMGKLLTMGSNPYLWGRLLQGVSPYLWGKGPQSNAPKGQANAPKAQAGPSTKAEISAPRAEAPKAGASKAPDLAAKSDAPAIGNAVDQKPEVAETQPVVAEPEAPEVETSETPQLDMGRDESMYFTTSRTSSQHQAYADYLAQEVSVMDSRKKDLEALCERIEAKKDLIGKVASKGGYPPEMIGAIWYRENDSLNDRVYLHNGQRLGKTTTIVPTGIFFPDSEQGFIDAAVDALAMKRRDLGTRGMTEETSDLGAMSAFTEGFNGFGYQMRGEVSPYVMAGTGVTTGGLFVKDGVKDDSKTDKRFGTYPIMKALMERGNLRGVGGGSIQTSAGGESQSTTTSVNLTELLAEHSDVKTNQHLINLFFKLAGNDYSAASSMALSYGVSMSDLVANRSATIKVDAPANAADKEEEKGKEEAKAPESPLDTLLAQYPDIKTNQQLINLFYTLGGNTFSGATNAAKGYGVVMDDLLKDRNASIGAAVSKAKDAPPVDVKEPEVPEPKPEEVKPKVEEPVADNKTKDPVVEEPQNNPQADVSYAGEESIGPGLKNSKTAVTALQTMLSNLGSNFATSIDGSFGRDTMTKVMYYQYTRNFLKENGEVDVDGVAGPKTWKALRANKAATYTLQENVSYKNYRPMESISLSKIKGNYMLESKRAEKYLQMDEAYKKAKGASLGVRSAHRFMSKYSTGSAGSGQIELYALYKMGGGNLAAKPGRSNHQSGISVDIDIGPNANTTPVYKWLGSNASKYGFVNDGKTFSQIEYWHWTHK